MNPASQNIIPHNKWVPVCNFMYTKLAEKPMGVGGAGPFAVAANEFEWTRKEEILNIDFI